MSETTTPTLTDFLLARIAEDEADARYADEAEGNWHYGSLRRVLAECEARRRLIADLTAEKHSVVEDCWYTCAAALEDRDGGEACDDARRGTGCDCGRDARVNRRVGFLALPYADHPDFREEWRARD